MAIEIPVVKLGKGKGRPLVEAIFGDAHLGNYRAFLWDADGKNAELLSHGNNIDHVLDVFQIGKTPAQLDRRILSYEVIVQAAEAREGQVFSVTISVRQGGEVCDGGLIQETGTFRDVKSIIGFRRFAVS